MAALIWTGPARTALRDIFNFIASDNPKAARHIINEIREAAKTLEMFPMAGRIGRVEGSRELVIPRTQYVLTYRITGDAVIILAIFHGAQQWPDKL